jgi:hypothetical protein
MSVKECKRQVDSQEFTRWLKYFSVVPVLDDADQIQTANIMTAVFESAGTKKADGTRFSPVDFMREYWKEGDERDPKTNIEEAHAKFAMNVALQKKRLAQGNTNG